MRAHPRHHAGGPSLVNQHGAVASVPNEMMRSRTERHEPRPPRPRLRLFIVVAPGCTGDALESRGGAIRLAAETLSDRVDAGHLKRHCVKVFFFSTQVNRFFFSLSNYSLTTVHCDQPRILSTSKRSSSHSRCVAERIFLYSYPIPFSL